MSLLNKTKLSDAMKDAGMNAARLANLIGRDKDYIRDYLTDRKKSLKLDDLQKIADALQVPLSRLITSHTEAYNDQGVEIVGKVAAGFYKDISVEDQDVEKPRIAVARDMRFPHARHYALVVEGDSMDELFGNGTVVVCVEFVESGLELRDGMFVHVERYIMGGHLVENTLKQVGREGKSKIMLYPRSSNPSHKPLPIIGSEEDNIVVRGVVVGKYEPVAFGV